MMFMEMTIEMTMEMTSRSRVSREGYGVDHG